MHVNFIWILSIVLFLKYIQIVTFDQCIRGLIYLADIFYPSHYYRISTKIILFAISLRRYCSPKLTKIYSFSDHM